MQDGQTPAVFIGLGNLRAAGAAQHGHGIPELRDLASHDGLRELEEAARIHHASWISTFRRIWLPLVKNGFVAGWVILFTVSFSDLATVAFLYGSKSMALPALFLSQWSNGRLEEAAVAALMMTVIVLAVVVLVRRVVQGNVRTTTTVA